MHKIFCCAQFVAVFAQLVSVHIIPNLAVDICAVLLKLLCESFDVVNNSRLGIFGYIVPVVCKSIAPPSISAHEIP